MALPDGERLLAALEAVSRSQLTAAERKSAGRRAIEVFILGETALGVQPAEPVHFTGPVDVFDNAISAVKEGIDTTDPVSVTEAKNELRSRGEKGSRLASRLGKASKTRNGVCHLDRSLGQEIKHLLKSSPKEIKLSPLDPSVSAPAVLPALVQFAESAQAMAEPAADADPCKKLAVAMRGHSLAKVLAPLAMEPIISELLSMVEEKVLPIVISSDHFAHSSKKEFTNIECEVMYASKKKRMIDYSYLGITLPRA